MPTIIALLAASVVWIVSWAIGLKGFDGFLVFLLIILGTATVQMLGGRVAGSEPAAPETD